MKTPTTALARAQEAAEDIFFGQVVLIYARWAVIFAGVVMILTAVNTGQLVIELIPIVLLMALNFFLHGRYFMERPANRLLIAAAGVIDLVLLSAIVVTWPSGGGVASPFFVFLYPVVFAFALVFQPAYAAAFGAIAAALYGAVCYLSTAYSANPAADTKTVFMRLVTLLAMAGLGTLYWRKQRDRRRAAAA